MQERRGTRTTPPNLSEPSALTVKSRHMYKASNVHTHLSRFVICATTRLQIIIMATPSLKTHTLYDACVTS